MGNVDQFVGFPDGPKGCCGKQTDTPNDLRVPADSQGWHPCPEAHVHGAPKELASMAGSEDGRAQEGRFGRGRSASWLSGARWCRMRLRASDPVNE